MWVPEAMSLSLFLNVVYRNVSIYGRADQGQTLEPLLIWATPGQRGFGSMSSQRSNAPAPQAHSHAAPAYTSYHDYHSTSHSSVANIQRAPVLTPAQEAAQRKLAEDMRKATELRQILGNLEKVDDEGRRASLLDQLLSTEDVLTLPEHPNPPGIEAGNLTVNLLKHQVCI
jgi:SWI/SNF-related matrix-associated actin-dependent regulator of chromatin subfamily A3